MEFLPDASFLGQKFHLISWKWKQATEPNQKNVGVRGKFWQPFHTLRRNVVSLMYHNLQWQLNQKLLCRVTWDMIYVGTRVDRVYGRGFGPHLDPWGTCWPHDVRSLVESPGNLVTSPQTNLDRQTGRKTRTHKTSRQICKILIMMHFRQAYRLQKQTYLMGVPTIRH